MIDIVAYRDAEGREPFFAWLDGLDRAATRKVRAALARLAAGNLSDVKSAGGGVLERRVHWGPGYRLYFGRDGDRLVILLAGGTKQRQQRDIADAHTRWADYKRRTRR